MFSLHLTWYIGNIRVQTKKVKESNYLVPRLTFSCHVSFQCLNLGSVSQPVNWEVRPRSSGLVSKHTENKWGTNSSTFSSTAAIVWCRVTSKPVLVRGYQTQSRLWRICNAFSISFPSKPAYLQSFP